ncbi:MIP/aquaporin family protein [Streptococcus pseudoporcinus]|uniref:Glycerol uptake facilitator protein 1 n=1 Tax=Streptococcus pseudoporcinus TaxID=361101 RepID=A0A4U9Y4K7_9STRE|nr:MIP/aquaporin family protein [Streptococcus pseudoporcinus]VTS20748.1 glycerol uptake facilitator protein 1 [Streptococcus pseudoporcinus]VUC69322.1 glycerol uptake facilitator protein 1 [Streptococcus pseudoporcinus]VUC99784.1 glycerol uptake facilitator protein 1 [Streptococcus pseudoporcinus]VUD00177.1 glycerol uptake facilitator protein 1 [Streptococcus pseudoporcinus]
MDVFGEFLGTTLLILLGNGVVAGVVLPKTKNNNSGWIVIAMGWGIAVAVAAFVSGKLAPAHLNPAVSIAFALNKTITWGTALMYIVAQMLGAMLGSILVFLQYRPHYQVAENPADILGTFATGPAIKDTLSNLLSEIFGTFVLMLGILSFGLYHMPVGLGTLCVGTLIIGIGLSLGGTTGYAINPARDLGPRIIHAILPIKHKGDSDWSYSWIPIIGPIVGASLAVLLFQIMK